MTSQNFEWRDVRGREAALKFDLLVARLQEARLSGSATADDLRDRLIEDVSSLPINLKPVAERIESINRAKSHTFYQSATAAADLETLRSELRGIMHNRRRTTYDPIGPRILTVREEDAEVEYSAHQVKLEGLDLAAYRSRVESVLQGLLEQSEALRKIRAGQPVAPGDIESLVDEVLLQDPDLHLEELLVHYPNKSKNLEFAIRQVIGLDSARVDAHFRAFVQRYPALNANQIRFLDLLKSYLSRYGAIELDKLWEAPFTTIDSAGIDGVFQDSDQIDALLELLQDFNGTPS